MNAYHASIAIPKRTIVLATAQVLLEGPRGVQTRVRALLDQGFEASFVIESITQLLELQKCRMQTPLSGLGAIAVGTARATTQLTIRSITEPSFCVQIEALVLSKLTSHLPVRPLMEINFKPFRDFVLVDPHFCTSDLIDVILGADIYGQLLRPGVK